MAQRITSVSHSPVFTPLLYRANKEHNPPAEYKGWDKIPDLKDIAKDEKQRAQLKDNENGKWIKDLFKNFDLKTYQKKLAAIVALGYSKDEAKQILKLFVLSAERSTDWAIDAAHKCGNAVNSILFACPFAFVKALINNFELNVSGWVKRSVGGLDGLFTGVRNYFQNMIYGGRFDDDRARNKYEAENYGNKIGLKYGDRAFNTETKINPWALPLVGALGGTTQDVIKPILITQNPIWFRSRMGSDINQEFGTDFVSLLVHKPLSLIGRLESRNIISEIRGRGNLGVDYVSKRIIENIGLDPKKNKLKDVIPETFKLVGGMFSGKTEVKQKKKASEKIAKCFGPFLGLWGFLALSIGAPLKGVFSFFGKQNKYVNSFFQSGFGSQHVAYIFKFLFPEQYENDSQNYTKYDKDFNEVKKDRNKLFVAGLTTFLSNIAAVGTKLFKIENKYLKFASSIFDEIIDKGVAHYFSLRRHLIGRKHKIDNPELYDGNSVKIISDKLEALEKEEKLNPLKPKPDSSRDIISSGLN